METLEWILLIGAAVVIAILAIAFISAILNDNKKKTVRVDSGDDDDDDLEDVIEAVEEAAEKADEKNIKKSKKK